MAQKLPTISVIIPVYNDERYMRGCLDAIQAQSMLPHEVIVIDNNCTDNSIHIAKEYDFVNVVTENNQGLWHARNTGFSKASGEILLRIDADTILDKDYSKRLCALFKHETIGAVTGYGISRYEAIPKTSLFWSWCYFTYTHAYFGHPMLWGANMAFRRNYWQKLQSLLLADQKSVHEDQDITLALASIGVRADRRKELTVSVSMEGVQHVKKFHAYVRAMRVLKQLDKQSHRYTLATRLPQTSMTTRTLYWVSSAWSIYVFYMGTVVYSGYCIVKDKIFHN